MSSFGIRFAVRCTPRGGMDRVEAVVDGTLHVRVAAPAVDGAANDALLRLLATELGVPRGAVRLLAGATGRHKLVAVEGVDEARLVAHWPGLRV